MRGISRLDSCALRLQKFLRPPASLKCSAANPSAAASRERFPPLARVFCPCRKRLPQSPDAARGGDPLSRIPNPRTASASAAQLLFPEKKRQASPIPEFSAIPAGSYCLTAANSIIPRACGLSLTCPEAAARLILLTQKHARHAKTSRNRRCDRGKRRRSRAENLVAA